MARTYYEKLKELKKPISVWTNLCYIIFPLVSLFIVGIKVIIPVLFLVFLGIASGIYHYYVTRHTARLDWIGMFTVISALWAHVTLTVGITWVWPLAIIAGAAAVLLVDIVNRYALTALLSIPLLVLSWFVATIYIFTNVVAYFVVALILRLILEPRFEDESWEDLLHGAWHFFTAVGFSILLLV